MVELSPLRQLRMGQLPKMVSWYDPRLLARIGVRTIISSVFGQYADQRLIQAVTDPCDDKDLCTRYDYSDPNAADPNRRIAADENGAFWIDYVADVGDGFESTYAIAYLLAQDNLDVRQAGRLRHGEILIMGGDQCYPQATREEYKKKLLTPYNWAFTVKNPGPQAVRASRQPRLVRRPQLLRQPVLRGARQELQGQRDRRLAVPAAPQLLGHQASVQLVDLGRRHPVLEVPRRQPGQLLRDGGRADGAAGQPHRLPGGALLAAGGLHRRGRGGELLQDHHDRAQARRAHPRRHRRRLAPLRALFRPRARHSLHHVGRRRRLPASDPRPEERHLGALAGAPGRGGEPGAGYDRGPAGRGLEAEAVRHPPQAQHEGGRGRRRAGGPGREGRAGAAAEPARSRPSASASRSSRRRPSAIPRRARAICSASATSCSRSTIPASPSASVCSIGSSPGNSRRSSRATSISVGQDRQPRHRHVARRGAGLHAALSHPGDDRLDQPGRDARRPLRRAGVVRRRRRLSGPAPLPDEILRRHRPFPGAPHRHVHALAVHRHAQQLDDAADRERRQGHLRGAQGAERRSSRTSSRSC